MYSVQFRSLSGLMAWLSKTCSPKGINYIDHFCLFFNVTVDRNAICPKARCPKKNSPLLWRLIVLKMQIRFLHLILYLCVSDMTFVDMVTVVTTWVVLWNRRNLEFSEQWAFGVKGVCFRDDGRTNGLPGYFGDCWGFRIVGCRNNGMAPMNQSPNSSPLHFPLCSFLTPFGIHW